MRDRESSLSVECLAIKKKVLEKTIFPNLNQIIKPSFKYL